MTRLGILLSGRGSNFQAIAQAIADGSLPGAEIAIVLSNFAEAPGLAAANVRGIPTRFLSAQGLDRIAYDQLLLAELASYRVDWICLAGYMRLLSPSFVEAYRNRIVNIHPSLLPAFPGLHAQQQAFKYGVKVSGCTVHFVDDGLDSGPIILQRAVPVLAEDDAESLAARILVEEHRLYPEALRLLLAGRCQLAGRRVVAVQ